KTNARIKGLSSDRGRVDEEGIYSADVVLVPLEDGDRTEALVAMGKKVIAIDLNPISRTSRRATVTIVDNVVRAVPALIAEVRASKEGGETGKMPEFDNSRNLEECLEYIRGMVVG
ncbi:MAG: phosphopantothenate/pantothenate synthetase family protein, partial [Candidatus Hydrothermarchaeaceae archaeon]